MYVFSRVWCFFFQAEDGIRDVAVTGVQTCALPICPLRQVGQDGAETPPRIRVALVDILADLAERAGPAGGTAVVVGHGKIGRASCRERVEISVVAVSLKKKYISHCWLYGEIYYSTS